MVYPYRIRRFDCRYRCFCMDDETLRGGIENNEMDSMFPNMDECGGCSHVRHFPNRKNGLFMVLGGAGVCGLVVDVG